MSVSCQDDNKPVLKRQCKLHKKPITGLSFDYQDKHLASSSHDHTIMGHTDVVTAVQYASKTNLLASCSYDQTVRIWKPTLRGISVQFRAHTSAIRTIGFSPDSERVITGSNDKSIKLWNTRTKQFISSFVGHNNWVQHIEYTSDGQLIASCADDNTVKVWDVNSGLNVHSFETKATPTKLSVLKGSSYVAVGMSSGSVRVYDLRMRNLLQHYVLHDYTTCVSWHSSRFFLSSGKDGKLVFVDLIQGRPVFTVMAHDGAVTYVKFNSDGNYFASAGSDLMIMMWQSQLK